MQRPPQSQGAALQEADGAANTRQSGGTNRRRLRVIYSGHVQGVGFRYTVKSVAAGFEVAGTVRNLSDGRVELVAEGLKVELEAFRGAIRDEGLGGLIRNEDVTWSDALVGLHGFEIVR